RWWLAIERERIGFFQHLPGMGANCIFVGVPLSDVREKTLPDSAFIPPGAERVMSRLPVVKVSDHRNRAGVGRPDGKIRPTFTPKLHKMSAHLFVQPEVLAGFEKVDVEVG